MTLTRNLVVGEETFMGYWPEKAPNPHSFRAVLELYLLYIFDRTTVSSSIWRPSPRNLRPPPRNLHWLEMLLEKVNLPTRKKQFRETLMLPVFFYKEIKRDLVWTGNSGRKQILSLTGRFFVWVINPLPSWTTKSSYQVSIHVSP